MSEHLPSDGLKRAEKATLMDGVGVSAGFSQLPVVVLGPASSEQAADEQAEHDAVRAVEADPARYRITEPQQSAAALDRLARRLAIATAGTGTPTADDLAAALRRLETLSPMAAGLLVGAVDGDVVTNIKRGRQ